MNNILREPSVVANVIILHVDMRCPLSATTFTANSYVVAGRRPRIFKFLAVVVRMSSPSFPVGIDVGSIYAVTDRGAIFVGRRCSDTLTELEFFDGIHTEH